MPILFALVITFSGYGINSPAAVRVGVYQKFDQCTLQGMKAVAAMADTGQRSLQFYCIPVNG